MMFDEYYRMPDDRILCKDFWRDEFKSAEEIEKQEFLNAQTFEQKKKRDKVKLEQLEHAIKLEKGNCSY